MTKTGIFIALLSVISLTPIAVFAQGFTGPMGVGQGQSVIIKQLLPATVNLNQKRIKIEASTVVGAKDADLIGVLHTKTVTRVQSDHRFIVDETRPQTILKFTVTNSYIDEKKYTIGSGQTSQNCDTFVGKLEVSYQALDAATLAPLDSENLVSAVALEPSKSSGGIFKDTIGKLSKFSCDAGGKSSFHEAQDALVDGIVEAMVQRAAPTDQNIPVRLPGKKLEPLTRLAMTQRWGTLMEEAEKMEPLPKPEDDAYRTYMIALAKEAQAYDIARESAAHDEGKRTDITSEQAEADFQKAQKLLDDARKLYKDAIQAKANEKIFQEPDARMEKAVTVYATIARHKEEYQRFIADRKIPPPAQIPQDASTTTKTGSGQQPGTQPAPAPVAAATTNPLDQVVKFCQGGVDQQTILDYINDNSFLQDAKASSYTFDMRNDPLTLATNCKEKATKIQQAMRARLAVTHPPIHKVASATTHP